jgi:hypothetical protein
MHLGLQCAIALVTRLREVLAQAAFGKLLHAVIPEREIAYAVVKCPTSRCSWSAS